MQKCEGKARNLISVDNADIRLIKIFIRVVEAGGLSAAQAELNLSLSTISGNISALEERLGVTLCKRGRGGFELTESGRLIFDECQRLTGSLDQFSRKVSGLRSNLSGNLAIGLVDNTITDPVSPLARTIAKLAEIAPALHLSIDTKSPCELLRDVVSIATALTLLIAYPLAYGISCCKRPWRSVLVFLVIVPFWSSLLIRVYAWIAILSNDGLLNSTLRTLGLIDQPLQILNTQTAVYIGIVYTYLPFMVQPIYANLADRDHTLLEAARDLGCSRFSSFWRVIFPLSLSGVVAGSALVSIPVVGEFVVPDLLGGADTQMIGRTIWVEFFNNRDWPVAASVTVLLVMLLVMPITLLQSRLSKMRV